MARFSHSRTNQSTKAHSHTTKMKKKRVCLLYAQKRVLCVHHKQHSDMPRQMLCEWASAEFKLPRPLARSTLTDALRDPARYEALDSARKASHNAHSPQLEVTLVAWIDQYERWKFPVVTGAAIRQKAEEICGELIQDPTTSSSTMLAKLEFSKGWLFKFQARYGLKSRRVHSEAGSVSSAAVDEGHTRLQSVTSGYDRRDIYNMDKTAYFYCMSADKSVTKSSIPGRKKIKKSMTVAVTSNTDGPAKTPLFFIGTSRRSRCFGNKTGEELGLDYANAPKGWMNSEIFGRWTERFNETMRDEGRYVLLLLDNVSSHQVNVPLSNVTVQMLPPNTTSHIQPHDAGVIQAFKARLEHLKIRHIVDRFDALLERAPETGKEGMEREIGHLYHADVLEAMQWAQKAWESVSSTSITNCWRHAAILDEDMFELMESMRRTHLGPL